MVVEVHHDRHGRSLVLWAVADDLEQALAVHEHVDVQHAHRHLWQGYEAAHAAAASWVHLLTSQQSHQTWLGSTSLCGTVQQRSCVWFIQIKKPLSRDKSVCISVSELLQCLAVFRVQER